MVGGGGGGERKEEEKESEEKENEAGCKKRGGRSLDSRIIFKDTPPITKLPSTRPHSPKAPPCSYHATAEN